MLMDFPADTLASVQTHAIEGRISAAIGVSKDKVVNVETAKHCQYLVIEVDQSVDIESLKVDAFALVFLYFWLIDNRVNYSLTDLLRLSQIFPLMAL